jgi:hypothetical protein
VVLGHVFSVTAALERIRENVEIYTGNPAKKGRLLSTNLIIQSVQPNSAFSRTDEALFFRTGLSMKPIIFVENFENVHVQENPGSRHFAEFCIPISSTRATTRFTC